jgi:hypothetical protein
VLPGRDTGAVEDAAELALGWLATPATADPPRTLAVIWATVELERALADLGGVREPAALSGARADEVPLAAQAIEDPLLGARVVVVPTGGEIRIALAEPSTEGRLAATLARHAEGPAGRYVRSPVGLERLRVLAAAAGIGVSTPQPGPFGREVLVVAPLAGPHLVLVEPQPGDAAPTSGDPPAVPSPP